MASSSTAAYLSGNEYGKRHVRLLKVTRKEGGGEEQVRDLNVRVLLQGEGLDASYLTGDNSAVVPTDTVKNTIYVLAKKDPITHIETFGVRLVQHFLEEYSHIHTVEAYIEEQLWERLVVAGQPHSHSFAPRREVRTALISSSKGAAGLDAGPRPIQVVSGLRNLELLKTSGSGFVGFHKDRYTTLPEVKDRLLRTQVEATWTYNAPPHQIDFTAVWNGVVRNTCRLFAERYSRSVQETVYAIGDAVLKDFVHVQSISFTLPNIHNWTVDLTRFGLQHEWSNEILTPVSEPQGLIKGTITRPSSSGSCPAHAARL
ncbi:Uricase [Balamuthia mandrillaris]